MADIRASYEFASGHCQLDGAYLISIGDAEEEEQILDKVCDEAAWIGLKEYQDGYRWEDPKTPYTDSSYKQWYNAESDSKNGTLRCAYFNIIHQMWMNADCNKEKRFVCEWDPNERPAPPPTPLKCDEEKEDGWIIFPDISTEMCYKFGNNKKSWYNAETACVQENGTLASVHNWATNVELSRRFNFENIWIGLIAKDDKMEFQWTDGSPIDFAVWSEVGMHNGHCAQILGIDGSWSSKDCTDITNGYFCQKLKSEDPPQPPTAPPPPPMGHCKKGEEFLGYCYVYNEGQVTWMSAKNYCKNNGGQLASIHGEKEMAFIISHVLSQSHDLAVWIGGQSNDEVWSWSDKSPFNYVNWMLGRPERSLYDYKCMALLGNHGSNVGRWTNEDCEFTYPFMCKYSAHPEGPAKKCDDIDRTFTYLNDDGCYRYFETPETWKEAQEVCGNNSDSKLVTIPNTLTQSSLHAFLPKGEFWIGFSNLKNEAKFEWVDSSSYDYSNFANYKDHPPKTRDSCVYIDSDTGRWNVRNCNQSLPFVCKLSYEKPEPTIPSISWKHCPNNKWIAGPENRCFYINNELLDPSNADNRCKELGGVFAGIHFSSENDFLTPLLDEDEEYWIGLLRMNTGKYIWMDGELYIGGYTNWNKEDEFRSNVYISGKTGKWNSVNAYTRVPIIKPSICSVLKHKDSIITTTEKTGPPVTPSDPDSSLSIRSIWAIAISVGFLLIIGVVVLIITKKIRISGTNKGQWNVQHAYY